MGKRDGDIDSKPYTHYPSIQTNGDIHMRRVSDLVASESRSGIIRLTIIGHESTTSASRVQEQPEPPARSRKNEQLMALGDSSLPSDSNADGVDSFEIPKT
ncbi:hypothetical protein BT96DRAFT_317079 [Gymnopus androsaceus JB14]|uniref:Uncharacterized protein n=1 Tax=Gymnopus androsaceus JB14 TaxID=1447944 RepID=A0A6A4I9M2_9AGAR|nr:hypothetical protein BT96DRAFT_317079 [Gymnopus androsaceus JB14]